MTESQPDLTERSAWARGLWWKLPLLALLLLAVVQTCSWRPLSSRLGRIRAAGYPVTLNELDQWYLTPQGSNAADLYLEAFDHHIDPEFFNLPRPDQPLSDQLVPVITKYLGKNDKSRRLLHKAASVDQSRYPLDLSQGLGAPPPAHHGQLRPAAILLQYEATLHAARNEPEQASNSIHAMFRLAGSIKNEPILISRLVKISLDVLTIRTLEQVTYRTRLNTDQLARLSSALSESVRDDGMVRSLAGDRCMGLAMFDRPSAIVSRLLGDKSAYLDVMEQAIGWAKSPDGTMDDLDDTISRLPKWCVHARGLAPALAAALRNEQTRRAYAQAAKVAVLVQLYQRAEGRSPEGLLDLVPDYLEAVPADPFDGKPLRFTRRSKTIIVYSVGKDGIDNGGAERDSGGIRTDVTFSIPGEQMAPPP